MITSEFFLVAQTLPVRIHGSVAEAIARVTALHYYTTHVLTTTEVDLLEFIRMFYLEKRKIIYRFLFNPNLLIAYLSQIHVLLAH